MTWWQIALGILGIGIIGYLAIVGLWIFCAIKIYSAEVTGDWPDPKVKSAHGPEPTLPITGKNKAV